MEKVKTLLKANFARDEFETIFWGGPTQNDYEKALRAYQAADFGKRLKIEERLLKKVKKNRTPELTMSALHFLGLLVRGGNQFACLEGQTGELLLDGDIEGKDKAYIELVRMYHGYIRLANKKLALRAETMEMPQFSEQLRYCEIAI